MKTPHDSSCSPGGPRINRTTWLVVAGALTLTACGATAHWTRSNTTAPQFSADSYECAQQTTHDTFKFRAFRAAAGASYGQEVNKDLYRACMSARGYTRTDPNGWEGFRD